MALNAVQREIQDTLKKHPNWTSIQALHWNRKHNPATIHPQDRESFSLLGPRGVKYSTNLTSVITTASSTENAIKAGKIGKKILSIVTKGNFKRGSTGSRGG